MDIDARTRRSLEWDRLKSYLAAESSTDWSRELCLDLPQHGETQVVEVLLGETSEALSMLGAGFGLSQEGLPDLRDPMSRLRAGAQLSAPEVLGLRMLLLLIKRARASLSQLDREIFPNLAQFVADLHWHEQLSRRIDEVFDDDGNIRDEASPLLRQLRREVVRINNNIRDELTRIINSSSASKALQETIYTQRNGRYVLPVQASMRQSVQGIVHDSSASGLTVYVEPMSVVELTNNLKLKESAIEHEIERLLLELTELAREKVDTLETSNRTLVELDFIAARARLALRYNGTRPEISADTHLVFKQARHPLLVLQNQGRNASIVPNDISMSGDIRTLVITGPNTGGKTVYLKTAGLLSLMVKAGLLLPVGSGSSAVLFQDVFADIGDEQSLEQSLSTFSSHMTNIVEIVRRSGPRTLVLLDEVGAGTDPREGAALARAILEHLNDAGAMTLSSTHYGELKSLAYTTAGFINGSLEFDESTLSPTYRLRLGIPGSSKATTIAARLGLHPDLVQRTRDLLEAETTDVDEMIRQLEDRLKKLGEQEETARQELERARELQNQADRELEKLAQEREKLRQGVLTRMEEEFQQAKELVRSLIADLQKAPAMQKAQQVQQELEVLRKELGWMDAPKTKSAPRLEIGQPVKVRSLNQRGIVEAFPDGDWIGDPSAQITVRAGNIKIKVPLSDIDLMQAQPSGSKGPKPTKGPRLTYKDASAPSRRKTPGAVSASDNQLDVFVRTSNNTLDLRGQRVEEALTNLETFIDESFLHQVSPVMVIHGHGTGRVREAVRRFLSDSSYRTTFRPGENYEGGDGVTVVQFP